ncbi:MAG: VOC family protein [Bacteroidetes bacterium]|nr:VOC family protein [Bacteroidota bacterium]
MGKQRVTGIGGIFFKSKDPATLHKWYADMLGVDQAWEHGAMFPWFESGPDGAGPSAYTAWSIFPDSTKYMEPGTADFMVNYRVKDLHAMLDQLRESGVRVDSKIEESEFGKFGWVFDPDGNKIELWEPPSE